MLLDGKEGGKERSFEIFNIVVGLKVYMCIVMNKGIVVFCVFQWF